MRMSVRAKKIEIMPTQNTVIITIWHFLQFTVAHACLPAAPNPQSEATANEQMDTRAAIVLPDFRFGTSSATSIGFCLHFLHACVVIGSRRRFIILFYYHSLNSFVSLFSSEHRKSRSLRAHTHCSSNAGCEFVFSVRGLRIGVVRMRNARHDDDGFIYHYYHWR